MSLLDDVKAIAAAKKKAAIEPAALDLAIDEVKYSILEYCNILEVPEGLKYCWANMAIDLANYTYEINVAETDIIENVDVSDVSNIKIGDMQIDLKGGSATNERNKALRSHSPNLDAIVFNNREKLNKYRRMVW